MHAVEPTQVGNAVGVILSRDALARLRLERGDTLSLTNTPSGYRITVNDPASDAQMTAARKTVKRDRNTLAELAQMRD